LVIDNHVEPNAATTAAIEKMSAMPNLTIVPLVERRRGKSRAINKAVRQARGEILAITDDDCLVSKNWLTAIVGDFDRDPQLAAVGGRVELHDSRDYPITLRTKKERITYRNGDDALDLIIGANMAFRRQAFE